MNGSLLHFLPAPSNPSILSSEIPKTKSLSDLEEVFKTPSEALHVDRRNSVSHIMTMDASLSSPDSAIEALVGPFKTLEEAQVAATLLQQKTVDSEMPVGENLHHNINVRQNNISTAPSPHVFFYNESKEFTCAKPLSFLPTKGNENNETCSDANLDTSKIQANSYTSAISSPYICAADNSEALEKSKTILPTSTETPITAIVDAGNHQEDLVSSPKENKTETDSSTRKKTPNRKEGTFPSITKVASLVFFDLETTGLAFEIGKSNVQITEVSMIAINRKEFEQSISEDLKDIRIIQKLCLCTQPRSIISSSAAAVTGLNNENLMDQKPFERNAAEAINFFLSHLPKPVCLLAHNGNRYDFPLLKAEFSRLSLSLPPDILIADTLKAFRVLGVPVFPPEKKICEKVKFTKRGQVSYSLSNLYLYFFNKNPIGSHSSEGDCIALAKICHRMKDLILLWVDENCTTFDSVTPMW